MSADGTAGAPRRIAVTGATGRIGRRLCGRLLERGDDVVVLSRDAARAAADLPGMAAYVRIDDGRDWQAAIDGADAVVHLAGASIFDGRQTRASVEAATDERIRQTTALVEAIASASRRPRVLVAASSVGYYGYADRGTESVDEARPSGRDWWGLDAERWEVAGRAAERLGVRTVLLRTGWYLDPQSLTPLVDQFRRGLGGWILPGDGWRPWIHPADAIRLVEFALDDDRVAGALNVVSPNPVTSREFGRILGASLGRRSWLPLPGALLRFGMGVTADVIVHGRRVVPRRATELRFRFGFPTLEMALADLIPALAEARVPAR